MLQGMLQKLGLGLAAEAEQPGEAGEHALSLAAAVLFIEVGRADGDLQPEELAVTRAALQSTFGLGHDETLALLERAEEESRAAGSLYEFTQVVDRAFTPEQKKRIVELLWLVAFADSEKEAVEEHFVRRIAGLLHVAHPDFIDAKIAARRRSGAD